MIIHVSDIGCGCPPLAADSPALTLHRCDRGCTVCWWGVNLLLMISTGHAIDGWENTVKGITLWLRGDWSFRYVGGHRDKRMRSSDCLAGANPPSVIVSDTVDERHWLFIKKQKKSFSFGCMRILFFHIISVNNENICLYAVAYKWADGAARMQ